MSQSQARVFAASASFRGRFGCQGPVGPGLFEFPGLFVELGPDEPNAGPVGGLPGSGRQLEQVAEFGGCVGVPAQFVVCPSQPATGRSDEWSLRTQRPRSPARKSAAATASPTASELLLPRCIRASLCPGKRRTVPRRQSHRARPCHPPDETRSPRRREVLGRRPCPTSARGRGDAATGSEVRRGRGGSDDGEFHRPRRLRLGG